MQDPSSSIRSCLEAFEFSNGSSSGSYTDLQDFLLSSSDHVNMSCIDGATHRGSNLNNGSLGVSSTSQHSLDDYDHDGVKMDSDCRASLTMQPLTETGLLQAECLSSGCANITLHQNLPNAPLDHSNSNLRDSYRPQSSDINAGCVFTSIQPVVDGGSGSNQYKPLVSVSGKIPFTGCSSDPGGSSSGRNADLLTESDGMSGCSMDARRMCCKRKSLETLTGQPSQHAYTSLQQAEDNIPHILPSRWNMAMNISDSSLHPSSVRDLEEQLNPTIIGSGSLSASDFHSSLSVGNDAGSSQRNSRMRIGPICPEDLPPSDMWNPSNSLRNIHILRPTNSIVSQSDRLLDSLISGTRSAINRCNLLRPSNSRVSHSNASRSLVVTPSSTHNQPNGLHLHALHQSLQPLEGNAATNPRTGSSVGVTTNARIGSSSSSYAISSRRLTDLSEDASSMMLPRSISGRVMLPPLSEMRHYNQDLVNWTSANENVLADTNLTSLPSSSSVPWPTAGWTPNGTGSEHLPNRLSEVSGSIPPPSFANSGALISSFLSSRSFSAIALPDILLPSGSGIQRHGDHYLRSRFLIDRAGGSILGAPLSSRNQQAAFEGRLRLVSEIRNSLNRIHRESFRFEDIFILDQPVFGGTNFHDRYRDMRLDVDNMSYEELLALEERIGNVSTGLSEDTILKCLKQSKYSLSVTQQTFDIEPCCICQEEYVVEEDLGVLDCGHSFHVGCIKQWLMHKNLCPICKTTVSVTN